MSSINFNLDTEGKYYAIMMAPAINNINILQHLRKDIWKKSGVQNIVNTLNSGNLSVDSTDRVLETEFYKAITKEIQRQCDVWNSKL